MNINDFPIVYSFYSLNKKDSRTDFKGPFRGKQIKVYSSSFLNYYAIQGCVLCKILLNLVVF